MEITADINIEFTSKLANNINGWLSTDSGELKKFVVNQGYELVVQGHDEYYLCRISETEGSEKIEVLRQAIVEAGFIEFHGACIPISQRRTHFGFKYIRHFSSKDIEGSPYLLIHCKGINSIAAHHQTTEEGIVIKHSHHLKNKIDIGWLDLVVTPYVSAAGKKMIEEEVLIGAEFVPAMYEKPEKASKELYQLTSTITMPPCLLPLVNHRGEIIDNSFSELGVNKAWDDKGFTPPILKFNRKKVERIEPFDYAKTRELTGGDPRCYRHNYIVSQKFRQFIIKNKIKSFQFIPIELID